MAFFQVPELPEWSMGRRRAAGIRTAFRGMAIDKSRFPEDVYTEAAMRPGALTAMVNWYRAAARYRSAMRTATARSMC